MSIYFDRKLKWLKTFLYLLLRQYKNIYNFKLFTFYLVTAIIDNNFLSKNFSLLQIHLQY